MRRHHLGDRSRRRTFSNQPQPVMAASSRRRRVTHSDTTRGLPENPAAPEPAPKLSAVAASPAPLALQHLLERGPENSGADGKHHLRPPRTTHGALSRDYSRSAARSPSTPSLPAPAPGSPRWPRRAVWRLRIDDARRVSKATDPPFRRRAPRGSAASTVGRHRERRRSRWRSGAIGRPPVRHRGHHATPPRAYPPPRSRATIRIAGHAASHRSTVPVSRSASNPTIRRRSRSHNHRAVPLTPAPSPVVDPNHMQLIGRTPAGHSPTDEPQKRVPAPVHAQPGQSDRSPGRPPSASAI